ncbi:hypothetical protein WQ53_08885 [Pseudoxanthomonas suwonensis]|uniref:Secreted protein n=2 Tax=Pseudoxanthomonas suwonensis TaxID=314722 RepID=A0A0E3UN34_9GAMM|nr:hypothetical protein WQ53_08885 [Pseudoxanthomonas suwonensis]
MLVLVLVLAGCRRESAPAELPGAASEPAGAVRQLAGHLQRNDLVAFARDALPAEEHARLAEAWEQDRTRWPLTELPLDEQLGPLLATLSAPGSEATLRRSFERQMAGQDAALREAARSLALFGTQYVRHQGDYSDEERAHYAQIITALGSWSATAPLGDRKLAAAAIDRLAAAARDTGLDGDPGLDGAGMEDSLRRLGPFAAVVKAVLAGYGLDLDRSLADLRTGLVEEDGDRATVRIHYPLAGSEIDTTVSLTRRDGHWYLTDYLEHAAALLAEPPADGLLPGLPAPPATEPPAGPAAAR